MKRKFSSICTLCFVSILFLSINLIAQTDNLGQPGLVRYHPKTGMPKSLHNVNSRNMVVIQGKSLEVT